MNEGVKILKLPMPKHRCYWALGNGDWTLQTIKILSRVKPESEAALIPCPLGAKAAVTRLHSLGRRYNFRVVCRTIRDSRVLVWVKKPGIDKHILDLWYEEKPTTP